VNCWIQITTTIQQAKTHGWRLWVGGAFCKRCDELWRPPAADPTAKPRRNSGLYDADGEIDG